MKPVRSQHQTDTVSQRLGWDSRNKSQTAKFYYGERTAKKMWMRPVPATFTIVGSSLEHRVTVTTKHGSLGICHVLSILVMFYFASCCLQVSFSCFYWAVCKEVPNFSRLAVEWLTLCRWEPRVRFGIFSGLGVQHLEASEKP